MIGNREGRKGKLRRLKTPSPIATRVARVRVGTRRPRPLAKRGVLARNITSGENIVEVAGGGGGKVVSRPDATLGIMPAGRAVAPSSWTSGWDARIILGERGADYTNTGTRRSRRLQSPSVLAEDPAPVLPPGPLAGFWSHRALS